MHTSVRSSVRWLRSPQAQAALPSPELGRRRHKQGGPIAHHRSVEGNIPPEMVLPVRRRASNRRSQIRSNCGQPDRELGIKV